MQPGATRDQGLNIPPFGVLMCLDVEDVEGVFVLYFQGHTSTSRFHVQIGRRGSPAAPLFHVAPQ
jgi:hypothetical protein